MMLALVLLAASVSGVLATGATPASAASGVYIVTPKWWGWCPNIRGITNRVTFVSVTNTATGYSQTDYGDDIGWTTVALNRSNTVRVNVGCSLGHGSTGTEVRITPRRNGQTFWVSPTGGSYGN